MGFLETYDLANAASFKARIVSGIVAQAGVVVAEDQGDKSDAWYNKRISLAMSILNDPITASQRFIWPVLSNVSIAQSGLSSTDSDLQFQISQVWDNLAGVTSGDKTPTQTETPST